ncbi:DsrE family protein [Arthrobacter sp. L77]|uniref:DsrE family protein n=1 Tax=Arthrobacter sp. L77 TaxID=1496689 RepID=UPI001E5340AE|nr:hypothetical protein [Arthrobacter sp. L77]
MSATHSTPGVRPATDVKGLLIHAAGPAEPGSLGGALRSATNASAALPPGSIIEVVIQGPVVAILAGGSEVTEAIADVLDHGVRILACENSMRSADMEPSQLLPGIDHVSAAVAHLASRQWEGWAYVRM